MHVYPGSRTTLWVSMPSHWSPCHSRRARYCTPELWGLPRLLSRPWLHGCSTSTWAWDAGVTATVVSPISQPWSHCCSVNSCILDSDSAAIQWAPVPCTPLAMIQWEHVSPKHRHHYHPELQSNSPSMRAPALDPEVPWPLQGHLYIRQWSHCHQKCITNWRGCQERIPQPQHPL